jgi:uncharacterized membrane protein
MPYLQAYFAALLVFLVLDGIWLGLIAKSWYAAQLGGLLRSDVNWFAAGGFYLVYVAGLLYFAVVPALAAGGWGRAAGAGALLGLIAYGTYDMTNLATLKGWPAAMSVVDIAWGAVLTGAAASAGYFAARL